MSNGIIIISRIIGLVCGFVIWCGRSCRVIAFNEPWQNVNLPFNTRIKANNNNRNNDMNPMESETMNPMESETKTMKLKYVTASCFSELILELML
jgi:hypothetical protein